MTSLPCSTPFFNPSRVGMRDPSASAPLPSIDSHVGQERANSYAWFLLGFFVLLNSFNMVDRQLISSLAVSIKSDLQVTSVGIGLLTGYAFSILYSLMGLYLGIVADRINRVRLIAVGLFLWSAATAMSGVARSFNDLLMARIFVGIGEATLTPAAVSMLMEVFPTRQRSLAAGLYYAGLPIGVSSSFAVAGWLEKVVGWRSCFGILGVSGVVLAGLVLLLRENRTSTPWLKSTPHVWSSLRDLQQLLRASPALVLTMIGGCALNMGVGATMLDVAWMHEVHSIPQAQAAKWMALFYLCGGLPGNFIGGWLGGFVEHRLKIHRLYAVLMLMCISVPMLLVYRLSASHSPWLWVGYFFTAVSVTMYYGPVLSTVTELAPPHLKSTVVGFFLIGLNLLGISFGALMAPVIGKACGNLTVGLLTVGLGSLLCVPLFIAAASMSRSSSRLSKA